VSKVIAFVVTQHTLFPVKTAKQDLLLVRLETKEDKISVSQAFLVSFNEQAADNLAMC